MLGKGNGAAEGIYLAPVAVVDVDCDARIVQAPDGFDGAIGGAVVDHDNFVIGRQLVENGLQLTTNIRLAVKSRHAYTGPVVSAVLVSFYRSRHLAPPDLATNSRNLFRGRMPDPLRHQRHHHPADRSPGNGRRKIRQTVGCDVHWSMLDSMSRHKMSSWGMPEIKDCASPGERPEAPRVAICCIVVCYRPDVAQLMCLCRLVLAEGASVVLVDNSEIPHLRPDALPGGC